MVLRMCEMRQNLEHTDAQADSRDGATVAAKKVHFLGISRSCDVQEISRSSRVRFDLTRSRSRQTLENHGQSLATSATRKVPDSTACGISRVQWVEQGFLAGAVTSPPLDPVDHARLLGLIHQSIDILPMQFGTDFPDEEASLAFLDRRGEHLLQCLDRLRGACEMALRVKLKCSQAAPVLSRSRDHGRVSLSPSQYLAQRRTSYQWEDRLDDQAELYVRALQGLYRDWRRLPSPSLGSVRLSFLVERLRLGSFQHRLNTLTSEQECDRFVLMGPWPPYSFV